MEDIEDMFKSEVDETLNTRVQSHKVAFKKKSKKVK